MIKILDGKEVEMTSQEIAEFEKSREAQWSKEQHLAEINALHKQEFKRRYTALEYEDGWDVHLYAEKPELGFQEEANELLKYWTDGFAAIKTYAETVTEQKMIEPIKFVNDL